MSEKKKIIRYNCLTEAGCATLCDTMERKFGVKITKRPTRGSDGSGYAAYFEFEMPKGWED